VWVDLRSRLPRHGDELELRDLAVGVGRGIGGQIRRRFHKSEEQEDAVFHDGRVDARAPGSPAPIDRSTASVGA